MVRAIIKAVQRDAGFLEAALKMQLHFSNMGLGEPSLGHTTLVRDDDERKSGALQQSQCCEHIGIETDPLHVNSKWLVLHERAVFIEKYGGCYGRIVLPIVLIIWCRFGSALLLMRQDQSGIQGMECWLVKRRFTAAMRSCTSSSSTCSSTLWTCLTALASARSTLRRTSARS